MEVFKIPSSSSSAVHTVRRWKENSDCDMMDCTCPGWRFSRTTPKSCPHTRRLLAGEAPAPEPKAISPLTLGIAKLARFRAPMLAHPLHYDAPLPKGDWVVERKFDGHRVIVSVHAGAIIAWSRAGNVRTLHARILRELEEFPSGVYDGELVVDGGGRAHDVKRLTSQDQTTLILFDAQRILKEDVTGQSYTKRRAYLSLIFKKRPYLRHVGLAESTPVATMSDVRHLVEKIWSRDGEGVIVKRTSAPYLIGKRSHDVLKWKRKRIAVLTITGFKTGKCGPVSITLLKDDKGVAAKVRTLTNRNLARIGKNPKAFIGRRLCIEYQERTPAGGYREPRWDRFEDE